MSTYVRVSISARQLKKDIEAQIGEKVPPLVKNPQLRNALAREYGNAVTRFVPRSTLSGHHMQTFSVSDGRVMWSRKAREDDIEHGIVKGEEIAKLLYESGPIVSKAKRGQWRVRANGGNEYGPHSPTNKWDDNVRPGTASWPRFVERAAEIVKDYINKG